MKKILVWTVALLVTLSGCQSAPATTPINYGEAMSAQMQRLGAFTRAITPLVQNPQLGDQQWGLSVAAQTAEIEGIYEAIAKLTPPSEEISRHIAVLSGLGDCAAAMRTLTLANDKDRADYLPTSNGLLERCSEKMVAVANQGQ